MQHQIALIYTGKTYQVKVNEDVIMEGTALSEVYRCFEQTIQNNQQKEEGTWESVRDAITALAVEQVEVFDAYQALQYDVLKYFHQTGKLFFMGEEEMLPLIGGHKLLFFLLERKATGQLTQWQELLALCVAGMKNEIDYRFKDATFVMSSPAFNYGTVSYNFLTGEMHKGTSIEKCPFDAFRGYVKSVIG